MFPWESDDTGEEATPPFALTGTFEHHITADIAIAFWNYYRVAKDKVWLKEKGCGITKIIKRGQEIIRRDNIRKGNAEEHDGDGQ